MARIRSIKPEVAQDAKLASVSREARYHFVLLWTIADDEGFFRANLRSLLGQLYPHDSDVFEADVELMNRALARIGVVEFHTTPDGSIGYLCNWQKHQRIDRPSKSHLREIFASVSREARDGGAAGVLSPESLVLSPERAFAAPDGGEPPPPDAPVPASNPPRRAKRAPEAADENPNWVAVLGDWWRTKVGQIAYGRVGKDLREAVETYGVDRTRLAMELYVAHQESRGKDAKWSWFLEQIARWIGAAATPPAIVDGEMNATLELLTRPAVGGG